MGLQRGACAGMAEAPRRSWRPTRLVERFADNQVVVGKKKKRSRFNNSKDFDQQRAVVVPAAQWVKDERDDGEHGTPTLLSVPGADAWASDDEFPPQPAFIKKRRTSREFESDEYSDVVSGRIPVRIDE